MKLLRRKTSELSQFFELFARKERERVVNQDGKMGRSGWTEKQGK